MDPRPPRPAPQTQAADHRCRRPGGDPLDWDYARPEWLVWELGRSLWEFAKDKRRHDLKPKRAGEFLAAYRAAGGPVPRDEEHLLVPMIRSVRLAEALRHLTDAAHGRPWDAFYTTHNLRSFENLRRWRNLSA